MKHTRQFPVNLIQGKAHHRRLLLTGLCLMAVLALTATRWHNAHTTQAAAVFNTITVTTAMDEDVANGVCSLREAIIGANTNTAYHGCSAGAPGLDRIEFNIGTGTPTIPIPTSDLPYIIEPLQIDGATGGAERVELRGPCLNLASLNSGCLSGLNFNGSSSNGSSVKSLVINQFSFAIIFASSSNNDVSDCYIGTDATGTIPRRNNKGLYLLSSSNNLIGGGISARRNVISGNASLGIEMLYSSDNRVQGNFIGVDKNGATALGNGGLLELTGAIYIASFGGSANNNLIGGTTPGERNVISGNYIGIAVSRPTTSNNVITGNYIGTDVTGSVAIPNTYIGISIDGSKNTIIGGPSESECNLISGNAYVGLKIGASNESTPAMTNWVGADNTLVQGNYIGTDATGSVALGNSQAGILVEGAINSTILQNRIANNGRGITLFSFDNAIALRNKVSANSINYNALLGIGFNGNGVVTSNDNSDNDSGPNNMQNFPALNLTVASGVITGSLDSLPGNSTYPIRIEFFANTACDPSGYGEGEHFLGATTIDAPGSFTFNFTPVPGKHFITATATDADGNTSEFSACQSDTCQVSLPASLPAGKAGINYSQSLAATPAGSYNYSLQAGSLPSGFVLNPTTGLLSGTTLTTGTYNFTIHAQNGGSCRGTQSYTLVIGCSVITINPASLPGGPVGMAYNQTIAAAPAGGNYTYTYTGNLPTGLNLNSSTGVLSGTPTANDSYTFTVTATGFGGCTSSRTYTVVITGGGGGGCAAIMLPASLPNGSVGQLYNHAVAASPAGLYNYTYTGDLPPNVTLYSFNGLLFGYPTAPGSYSFTVTATQGACSGSQSYTVLIGAGMGSSLTVFSDFDGDGKSDLSVWGGTDGNWLVANSGDGQVQATQWGASFTPYNDVAVPGDYDGDGKTDWAVFRRGREHAGYWFIKRSSDGQVMSRFWGLGTDVPVPGDYDGDGKTDVAVWRGSAGGWYVWRSSDGGVTGIAWGSLSAGDSPVAGDYDGDGKTDVAVFRRGIQMGQPGQGGDWHIRRSSDGQTLSMKWGVDSDVPVPGDYDGDGKTDLAVWRGAAGAWHIRQSSNAAVRTVTLGAAAPGDWAVPGDYDGDGKADAAIWRESTGTWFVNRSSDDAVMSKTLGQSGDAPVAARKN